MHDRVIDCNGMSRGKRNFPSYEGTVGKGPLSILLNKLRVQTQVILAFTFGQHKMRPYESIVCFGVCTPCVLWYNLRKIGFNIFMARPKKTDGVSRHGKHALGMLRVSLYLSAEEKAIAVLTAERQGRTLSDVLRSGIVSEATRSGILKNGEIVEKYRTRITAYKNILEAEAQIKKGV